MSELLRLAWRLERRAPDLPVLLVSNEPSAGCTCCTRESDCDKLASWAAVKIAGYSRAVGQSRCKGRVRIGTVEGKLRGGGPGNRTRPPAWESNPAVLVEQLVDELDAVVGARAVDDLHVFGGDDEEGARQNVSCTGRVTLSGALVRSLWRIGLVRWFVEATVEESRITWQVKSQSAQPQTWVFTVNRRVGCGGGVGRWTWARRPEHRACEGMAGYLAGFAHLGARPRSASRACRILPFSAQFY